ncbi:hypothetical protein BGW80DRAFT_1250697 [Lactifluus volemus]|nr:hypothetical protein BGW80DRAFT_1250697 [Lactifluus volemus]
MAKAIHLGATTKPVQDTFAAPLRIKQAVERGVLVHPGDELDVLAVRTEVVELQLVATIRELYLWGQRGDLFAILLRRLAWTGTLVLVHDWPSDQRVMSSRQKFPEYDPTRPLGSCTARETLARGSVIRGRNVWERQLRMTWMLLPGTVRVLVERRDSVRSAQDTVLLWSGFFRLWLCIPVGRHRKG